MTPKNRTLEGKNRTLGGWGVKNRQKCGCINLYVKWEPNHLKLKGQTEKTCYFFLNKDFIHILTVLACYQLVNVDESDLENPEMYFWAANLFLDGVVART